MSLASIGNDIRFAVRMLAKNPVYTIVSVVTLALGIGANSTIFSLVHGALIHPLPFPEPDRIVTVWNRYEKLGLPRASLSGPDVVEIPRAVSSFESFAAFTIDDRTLTGGGEPARLIAARTDASLLDVLGVQPALGRYFLDAENLAGAGDVVVLSDGLWRRRFGADRTIVGRSITLNGRAHQVVGVMPRGFAFPTAQVGMPIARPDIWVPLALTNDEKAVGNRGNEYLFSVARLEPGATVAQAQTELTRLAEATMGPDPGFFRLNGWSHVLGVLREDATQPLRTPLLLLLGAVGFVLLIACGNVANLAIARVASRRREIALRTALGASRGQIAQQFMVESLIVALLGGGLGLLLGAWGTALVGQLRMPGLPSLDGYGVNPTIVLFTFGLSIATGLLFGILPALQAQSAEPNEALKETALTAAGSAGRSRMRGVLVGVEVALTVVLLVGAGLAIRSLDRVLAVAPGFDPDGSITVRTTLPSDRYPTGARQAEFYARAVEAIAARPGVMAAGAVVGLPLTGTGWTQSFEIAGRPAPDGGPPMLATYRPIAGDYFKAMRIPLLRGRGFASSSHNEIVVDQALAERYFPGLDAIGQTLLFGAGTRVQIVGVVGSVKDQSLAASEVRPMTYIPVADNGVPSMAIVVRTNQDPSQAFADLRRTLWNLDRDLPLFEAQRLTDVVTRSAASPRSGAVLLGVFAALAMFLAGVGIYGLIAYGVAQRTREIGVRVALGASPRNVLGVVLGQGMAPVFAGLAAGLASALALSRLIQSQLYGVSSKDPATYVVIALLVSAVATAATIIPARRALALDPVTALRYE